MSDDATSDDAIAAAIRAKMLGGLARPATFAAGIGKTTRTVSSYIAAGIPVEYVGRNVYIVIDPAIEWLRSRGVARLSLARDRPRKAKA